MEIMGVISERFLVLISQGRVLGSPTPLLCKSTCSAFGCVPGAAWGGDAPPVVKQKKERCDRGRQLYLETVPAVSRRQ